MDPEKHEQEVSAKHCVEWRGKAMVDHRRKVEGLAPWPSPRLKEKEALAALLKKLRAEGMRVLVEHDTDFVVGLVDRIVVMEFGQKIAGDPILFG